jgi:CubicO group peptidase (beta-lactamase class C family)
MCCSGASSKWWHDSYAINTIPPHAVPRMPPVLARAGGTVSVLFDPRRPYVAENSMPFAGFFSTTRDLGRFVQMMLNRGSSGGRQLLREDTVDRMFREEVAGQGIHQGLAWFLSSSRDEDGRSKPGGFWHTSSSGGLIAASRANGSAVIILTQAYLTDDLTPVRVTEWHYARQVTGTDPAPPNTPARVDAPAWFGELDKRVGGERCGFTRSGSDR